MSGWILFFTMVGMAFLTVQLFRTIDAIEHPGRRQRRRAAAAR